MEKAPEDHVVVKNLGSRSVIVLIGLMLVCSLCSDAGSANPDVREYHGRKILTTQLIVSSETPSLPGARGLTPEGESLFERVTAIPGVDHIYVTRYSIMVIKGSAFTFDEIEAELLPLLKDLQ